MVVDPDIDLSDNPDPALFDEFVVSPLSPPLAPHVPRAAAAPTRRTRGQALVAALQEIETGLAGPDELGEALELQQMWDAGRQGQQGEQSPALSCKCIRHLLVQEGCNVCVNLSFTLCCKMTASVQYDDSYAEKQQALQILAMI